MHGDLNTTLRVNYTCKDDTAVAGLDYEMNEVGSHHEYFPHNND